MEWLPQPTLERMNLHEYLAKELLARHGARIPNGCVVLRAGDAEEVVHRLHGPAWVVKAQIHAGGRGKAGNAEDWAQADLRDGNHDKGKKS